MLKNFLKPKFELSKPQMRTVMKAVINNQPIRQEFDQEVVTPEMAIGGVGVIDQQRMEEYTQPLDMAPDMGEPLRLPPALLGKQLPQKPIPTIVQRANYLWQQIPSNLRDVWGELRERASEIDQKRYATPQQYFEGMLVRKESDPKGFVRSHRREAAFLNVVEQHATPELFTNVGGVNG